MKTVIKQEFLSSMLLEIIGEREQDQERETERQWGQEREREWGQERERERDCLDRERKRIHWNHQWLSISAIINEFHM